MKKSNLIFGITMLAISASASASNSLLARNEIKAGVSQVFKSEGYTGGLTYSFIPQYSIYSNYTKTDHEIIEYGLRYSTSFSKGVITSISLGQLEKENTVSKEKDDGLTANIKFEVVLTGRSRFRTGLERVEWKKQDAENDYFFGFNVPFNRQFEFDIEYRPLLEQTTLSTIWHF